MVLVIDDDADLAFVRSLMGELDPTTRQQEVAWTPYPKQATAFDLAHQSDELLYGGAAGPGKTEWLMRIAISEMEAHAGNRGVIFRRVLPSASRSIVPRLQTILAGVAKWNENKHTFTFPNRSVLEISSLQYANTVHDFQGAEYGFIGFEELTEFLEPQYEYMLTRLRAPVDGVRPFAVATTNPGGVGHRWVKRRFIKPDPEKDIEPDSEPPRPLEIWRPIFDPDRHSKDAPPLRRVFVPAIYTDNPALLERDPGYLSRLAAQTSRGMRKALMTGDWDAIDAVEGALWDAEWLDLGRVSPQYYAKVVQTVRRVVAVDPSDAEEGGDAYGVAVVSRGADGVAYVEASYQWTNLSPKTLAMMTLRLAERVGADCVVVEKNHGGKWLPAVFSMVDPYCNVDTVWASDNKRTRAEPVSVLFEFHADSEPQVRGRIVGHQTELEEELTNTSFTSGEDSPNMLDAMVWGVSYLMLGIKSARKTGRYRDQRLAGRR